MSEFINNSEERLQRLQGIIKGLHAGADPASVKGELKELIGSASPGEIAAMEQALMAEGLQVEEIMHMCDLHHEVLDEILTEDEIGAPPGHPIDVMRRENEALAETVVRTRALMEGLLSGRIPPAAIDGLHMALNDIADVDKHYARKENLFFAVLERHGIDGPSKVMWGKDDEVRGMLRRCVDGLRDAGKDPGALATVLKEQGLPLLDAVEGMIAKETDILLPMCHEFFTEEEWASINADSPEYGWCLVEPRARWQPDSAEPGPEVVAGDDEAGVNLESGVLNVRQLTAIFRHLPVDITFVDNEDRVRYFSETPDRVFTRSRTIIGRKVQHCHPPSSVDIVERILEDFRSGEQSKAAFWIPFQDKFVHIQYFAVHDETGNYLGCLEVTQDIAPLQKLEGERRLLQYD